MSTLPRQARVVVTGGASGLGLALTTRFADRGDRVLVVDLAETRPASLAGFPDGTGPGQVAYQRLDVRDDAGWEQVRAWVLDTWGGLDLLVNNAGVAAGGRIDVESLPNWQRILDINLLGVVRGCRTFTPVFKEQRSGYIVNVASLAGLIHGAGMASYNASKAGVVALSETLAYELRPWHIGVSVVCPSFFRTNLHTSLAGDDAALERSATKMITRASMSAEDIAGKVLAGIDARRHIILTEPRGHVTTWMKRLARPAYDRVLTQVGKPLASAPTAAARTTSDRAVAGSIEVRAEDAFAVDAVADWLRGHVTDTDLVGRLAGVPEVRQFSGGVSNLTYLLRYPDLDIILRRPPTGTKARGAHDMKREHDLQAALAPAFPAVPRMVGYCGDEAVIGSEFYVMERLDGTILRTRIPSSLGLDESGVRRLCENAIDLLGDLHAVDVGAVGLDRLGKGEGYVARQVSGWAGRYRKARTRDVGSFEKVIAWLEVNQPGDAGHVLIHNDYRFDNLVLAPDDPTRIVGVLDWELATIGDPLMDLGSSLAYWVQADDDRVFRKFRRQPTHTPGMLTRAEVVARYCARAGIDMDPQRWTFYEVFGLFRLAVIAQQIYYRYAHKQTTNPAYREFQFVVIYLEYRCRRLIREHRRRAARR